MYQANYIVHISFPVSRLAIYRCCCYYFLLQVLHLQVDNNGGYRTALGYSKLLLVNFSFKFEVCHLQDKFQQLVMSSTFRFVLFFSVLSFSSLFLMISHASLIGVFVNSDTTSYDTNDSPSSTLSFVISFTSSCEFSVWCSVFPTSGCSMLANSLDTLYAIVYV